MPRLSLYRPEKGNDYKFIDKTAWEMFQVGGTDVLMHKYLGTEASSKEATPSEPKYDTLSPTNIQDMLFLENRDRKYDLVITEIFNGKKNKITKKILCVQKQKWRLLHQKYHY